tara:strand:+ start:36 stop:596 length:561 start_codon:yes stop_codon:yes gene_type:complete
MPKICKKCNNEFPFHVVLEGNNEFPFHVVVEGKKRNLKTRKFCLDCSPFGKRNTRDLTKEKDYSISYCKDCDESKPIADFYIKTDGRPYSYCKKCWSRRRVAYNRNNKKDAIAYLGGSCQVCGYNKCDAALEFHHKDPTKKDFSISKHKGVGIDKIKPELDKCALLCANCHRETHQGLHDLSQQTS